MPLIPLWPLLELSRDMRQKKIYIAHGAYNVNSPSHAEAAIQKAEELNAPLILQGSEGANGFMSGNPDYRNVSLEDKKVGAKRIADAVKKLADQSTIPIVLHLDHGSTYDSCVAAIDAGYTSVMIDLSHLSLEENIEVTKKVVEYAHARGVSVEAEIGVLMGMEEHVFSATSKYTRILDAVRLISETGIDALAISYGTSHGVNKGDVNVRTEIAIALYEIIMQEGFLCELVSHGSSEVPPYLIKEIVELGGRFEKPARGVEVTQLQEVAKYGISKINIDTDIRLAITRNVRNYFSNNNHAQSDPIVGGIWKLMQEKPDKFDPRYYMVPIMQQMIADDRSNPYVSQLIQCMMDGVKEIMHDRICQLGGTGYAPFVKVRTLEDMAQIYANRQ